MAVLTLEYVCVLGHVNCSYEEQGPCVRRMTELHDRAQGERARAAWDEANWDELGENPH